jgi:hypothetical protein
VLGDAVTPKNWLARYRAGEREVVWAELVGLGASVRGPQFADQAVRVARETMARARQNVEEIHRRLTDVGYEFQNPGEVHVPPAPEIRHRLDEQESKIGPIPLSLRAFYEVVGTVDFKQSVAQLVSIHRPERSSAPELRYLGEYDPLVVARLNDQPESRSDAGHRHFFAADEFHKAGYSGGDNYHVVLPDARADFPIWGMYEIDEFFVPYLRATFAGGGFRGKIREIGDRCVKDLPNLVLTAKLAEGLLPI